MATVTINNETIEVDGNKTLLDVIRESNTAEIPTLCHSPGLEPFGSCSICLAEVNGAPTLKRTCATPVSDGMVVDTENERVKKARKTNLELLLANHHADCYAPCRLSCPANVDIQGYIALTRRGMYEEAVKLMKETNPLPVICGRVCAKPCESACRRNFIDAPVDIKNIKRFVADSTLHSDKVYTPSPGPDTGKKVAVIGSGPAGLSAAYFLRLKGHAVTIFEMMPEAGGMMRYHIPEYRLPKADLKREIDSILDMGVHIRFNTRLGRDFTLESLKQDGFDAIFLGIGAHLGKNTETPGSDLEGVMQGVDFLRDVNLGVAEKLHGTVLVVGGGNTAIDAARTALRHGAEKVTVVYRQTEKEMPAALEEIEDAKEENVKMNILRNPIEYMGSHGRLNGVKLVKMELGEPDASDRRRPVAMAGSEYVEPADFVIEAIGQKIDTADLENLSLNRWNAVDTDSTTFATSLDGVFAGGDVVTGPDLIINAVAQGRKAAHAMDCHLKGLPFTRENRLGFYVRKEDFGKLTPDEFARYDKKERCRVPKKDPAQRVRSFEEVETTLGEEAALEEASRCLECGCQEISACKLRSYAAEYGVEKKNYVFSNPAEALIRDLKPQRPVEDINPFIIRNFDKCILCGKCVQACRDTQVNDAIARGHRGVLTRIATAGDRPLKDSDCVFCGECVQACPVGALTEKGVVYSGEPWEDKTVRSTCGYCGVGCQVNLHVKNNRIQRITGAKQSAPNYGSLCVKGRYGFDFISSEERLKTPLIRDKEGFRTASWDEALSLVAEKFTAIRNTFGNESLGLLTSARMTNEENYIAQKFTRAVLKNNNVDHCARL